MKMQGYSPEHGTFYYNSEDVRYFGMWGDDDEIAVIYIAYHAESGNKMNELMTMGVVELTRDEMVLAERNGVEVLHIAPTNRN